MLSRTSTYHDHIDSGVAVFRRREPPKTVSRDCPRASVYEKYCSGGGGVGWAVLDKTSLKRSQTPFVSPIAASGPLIA